MPAILSNVPTRDRQLGGIAQLGERLTGSQEVSGSIPLISTRERHDESRVFLLVRSSWTERSAPVSGRTTKNKNWVLTITAMPVILSTVPTRDKQFGGIAQLGERLTGSQEVSGSIPLISTKKPCNHCGYKAFLLFIFTSDTMVAPFPRPVPSPAYTSGRQAPAGKWSARRSGRASAGSHRSTRPGPSAPRPWP